MEEDLVDFILNWEAETNREKLNNHIHSIK